VGYFNEIRIRINGHEIHSGVYYTDCCPWQCIYGYSEGDGDTTHLFLHEDVNTLEVCQRVVENSNECGGLAYILDVFAEKASLAGTISV